jgi:hypothetical protein
MLGSGVEDASKEHARVTAQLPGGGEIEGVGDRDVLYMRSELLGDELGGKEWMKLDLARTYDSLGIDLDALGQVGQGSKGQLEALAQASDDVSDEGREIVRGVDTNHYSTTIDLTKLGGNLAKLAELMGDGRIEVDVWIDDDERIRRVEWEQAIPDADGVRMTMIMEYVRFGVPVDIETPDDNDVFDATDLTIQTLQQRLN